MNSKQDGNSLTAKTIQAKDQSVLNPPRSSAICFLCVFFIFKNVPGSARVKVELGMQLENIFQPTPGAECSEIIHAPG